MNLFEYQLKIDAIKKMTTLKAREAELRNLYSNTSSTLITQYSYCTEEEAFDEKYTYKCYTKAFQDYTGNHLPLFLAESSGAATTTMFKHVVHAEATYQELCDIFEFTTHVRMSHEYYSKFIPKLARIIGDKPVPFEIRYQLSPSAPYTDVATQMVDTGASKFANVFGAILELEEIKRVLPTAIQYTVIEELLKTQYSKLDNAEDAGIPLGKAFQERARNWVTDADEIARKLGI